MNVRGLKSDLGTVEVAVYGEPSAFPAKINRAQARQRAAMANGAARVQLRALPASTYALAVRFTSLLADGAQVGVQVNVSFCRKPGGDCNQSKPVSAETNTRTQTGFFTIDKNDKIVAFDLTILNLGAANNPASAAERKANITQTCTPFQNCMTYMRLILFGAWDQAHSHTFVCRPLHSLLTPFRPEVHCPHVSSSGGGKCVDLPSSSFYDFVFEGAGTSRRPWAYDWSGRNMFQRGRGVERLSKPQIVVRY